MAENSLKGARAQSPSLINPKMDMDLIRILETRVRPHGKPSRALVTASILLPSSIFAFSPGCSRHTGRSKAPPDPIEAS
jgi:hypothetical protein